MQQQCRHYAFCMLKKHDDGGGISLLYRGNNSCDSDMTITIIVMIMGKGLNIYILGLPRHAFSLFFPGYYAPVGRTHVELNHRGKNCIGNEMDYIEKRQKEKN